MNRTNQPRQSIDISPLPSDFPPSICVMGMSVIIGEDTNGPRQSWAYGDPEECSAPPGRPLRVHSSTLRAKA